MSSRYVTKIIWGKIHTVQGLFLFCLILGISLLVFIQVVLRYVLHLPLMGIEEILIFPTAWLYFIGSAQSSYERTQIQAGIVSVFTKKPGAIYSIKALAGFITITVVIWLTYWAYQDLVYTIQSHRRSALLYWPYAIAQSAAFTGFLLMAVYSIVEFIAYMTKLLRSH